MPKSLSDPAVAGTIADAVSGRVAMHGSPVDWRDQIVYEIVIDRFDNPSAPPRHLPYDAPFDSFQGGSYAGIVDKLDYIAGLGVTALWLSPPLKNCAWDANSYHGYGIQDFLSAEPRFAKDAYAADDELRALVDAAHARGLYVIFDIVLHHAGDVFAYVAGEDFSGDAAWSAEPMPVRWRNSDGCPNPAWADAPASPDRDSAIWPSELRRNDAFVRRGTVNNDDQPDADFHRLKSFDLTLAGKDGARPVQDALIGAFRYVVARFDIDGFRIDTLKYLPRDFEWRFVREIKQAAASMGKNNFLLFGEVWDGEGAIARFIGRGEDENSDGGGVDAVQDFPLYYPLAATIKGLTPPSALSNVFSRRREIEQANLQRRFDAGRHYVTFLDNHDTSARFCHDCGPHFTEQSVLALACLFTLQGIPCLYYGFEQELSGGKTPQHSDDSVVREALWGKKDAFRRDGRVYRAAAELAALRRRESPLRRGRQFLRPISGNGCDFAISTVTPGVLVVSRIEGDSEIVLAINTDAERVFQGWTVVDGDLSGPGDVFDIVYSSRPQRILGCSGAAQLRELGTVAIIEDNGQRSGGPAVVLPIELLPLEAKLLRCARRKRR